MKKVIKTLKENIRNYHIQEKIIINRFLNNSKHTSEEREQEIRVYQLKKEDINNFTKPISNKLVSLSLPAALLYFVLFRHVGENLLQ